MTRFLRFLISDDQILKSIRHGDDSVLSYLYEKNVRMIMKYIIQNSGNEADARIVLQDSLVIFWEKARKEEFVLKSKISTYLYAVAKKKWLQELTYRKKHTTLENLTDKPSDSKQIDDSMEENELAGIVKQCMKQLSGLCQGVVLRRFQAEEGIFQCANTCTCVFL